MGGVGIKAPLPPHLATWPEIVPNSVKLGRFVYAGMIDVMRGISSHVSIGRARKKHGWMDAWFVLVREDPQLPSPTAS